jgi:TPR repeat protein
MFLVGLWNDWIEKDHVEAVKWYHKAAEQGHADAQFNLGVCFEYGQGVANDPDEAVKWYHKAAEQGNAGAQFNLGWCFKNGEGVEKYPVEAVKWYHKAAEQGHARAQNSLGVCFMNGQGVAKDLEGAAKWFQKAADQGHAFAKWGLDEVIRQIPEWRAKNSALTEQFRATFSVSFRSRLIDFTHGVPITPTPLTTTNACSNRGCGVRRSFRCVGARTPASQNTGGHLRALMAGH